MELVGSQQKIDEHFIEENLVPNSLQLKETMLTSAEISVSTALDNCLSLPDGHDLVVSKETGNTVLHLVLKNIEYRQICLECLEKEELQTSKVLVQYSLLDTCNSVCNKCLSEENFVPNARKEGIWQFTHNCVHVTHAPKKGKSVLNSLY